VYSPAVSPVLFYFVKSYLPTVLYHLNGNSAL
jgi:hypothetical protein